MDHFMKIIKILRVEDTRQWEEIEDDRWIPIPGSGTEHQCSRCGRSHEIHATVLLEDGKEAIVGTGCMKADESEIAGQIRSILKSQRTLVALERKLEKWRKLKIQADAIMVEVDKLPVPPCEVVKTNPVKVGYAASAEPTMYVQCGDCCSVMIKRYDLDAWERKRERFECAQYYWRERRQTERGMTYEMRSAAGWVADLVKRIEKQKKRIQEKENEDGRRHQENTHECTVAASR